MTAHILLDSHVFLWLVYRPSQLGTRTRELFERAETCVSTVSLWELAVKHMKGKLAYSPSDLASAVEALGAETLPLEKRHVLMLDDVAIEHGDPFDRMLIAQALSDQFTFLTADKLLLSLQLPCVHNAQE